MDANEYSLNVLPAAKGFAVLLNKAEWSGKGKRPESRSMEPVTERVIEAEPDAEPVIEPEPDPATKETIIDAESILAEIQARLEIVAEPIEEGPAVAASPAYIPNHILPLVTESEPVAPVEMRGKDIFLVQGDRRYRILCAGRAELLRANSPQQAGPYRLLHPGVQRAQVVGAD